MAEFLTDTAKASDLDSEKNTTQYDSSMAEFLTDTAKDRFGTPYTSVKRFEDLNLSPELYTSVKRFEDLNLSPELLKGLYDEMQLEKPSKIHEVTLPMIMTPPHKHLIAETENWSGKASFFVLGMLSRINPKIKEPQAICICPTRELAIQNMGVFLRMGKYSGITSELAIRKDPPLKMPPMTEMPPTTAQVIFGTPATIIKWLSFKRLGITQIKMIVVDDADHMVVEPSYKYNSEKIMEAIAKANSDCQVLIFSSIFVVGVTAFVLRIVHEIFYRDYNQILVKKDELSLDFVKQYKVYCPDELSKIMVFTEIILGLGGHVDQTVVYVGTRDSARMLRGSLVELGYKVTVIEGALSREDRDKIIKKFREGLTDVLISTEIDFLAGGFDQPNVNLVLNFDPPVKHDVPTEPDYEYYLYWVGRARKAAVFNFVCDDRENMIMAKIEEYFKCQVPEVKPWDSIEKYAVALHNAGLRKYAVAL